MFSLFKSIGPMTVIRGVAIFECRFLIGYELKTHCTSLLQWSFAWVTQPAKLFEVLLQLKCRGEFFF